MELRLGIMYISAMGRDRTVKSEVDQPLSPLFAYCATMGFAALCAFSPVGRLWSGFSLAYLPLSFQIIWLVTGISLSLLLFWPKFSKQLHDDQARVTGDHRLSQFVLPLLVLGVTLSFILLESGTHLLGDGQALLSNLAQANPIIKPREIGVELIARFLKGLMHADSPQSAQTVYQLISWACGVLYLVASALFSKRVRIGSGGYLWSFLFLITTGYVLLFFGYVENYAPLVLAVTIFCMLGILITENRVPTWSILIPLSLAVSLHIIALSLTPAAVYALVRETKAGKALSRWPFGRRWALFSLIGLVFSLAVGFWASRDLFVRFAFVPIITDRFTLGKYTLLSMAHIGDFLNLILMLFPGILVCAATVLSQRKPRNPVLPAVMFLRIAAISTLASVFLLDPKLGMARDWDLFAFSGVPLVLLCYVFLSRSSTSKFQARTTGILVISAGIVFLVPRILVQHSSKLGPSYAERCMMLDIEKNRTGFSILQNYYLGIGDAANQSIVMTFRQKKFPQERLLLKARDLTIANKLFEAKAALDSAGALDPTIAEYWSEMCLYYLYTHHYDSALTAGELADGLNPYNPITLQHLAYAHLQRGEREKARQLLKRTIAIDSTAPEPYEQLASLFRDDGDRPQYLYMLRQAGAKKGASPALITATVTELVRDRDYKAAVSVLIIFVSNGGDSTVATQLVNDYPSLKAYFPQPPTTQ
jgi:hypothetical protein